MKIAINKSYGSFKLSDAFEKKYSLLLGFTSDDYFCNYLSYRNNRTFIDCLEEFGLEKSGDGSKIKIVEIPDESTDYDIFDYDGIESVIYVLDGRINKVF